MASKLFSRQMGRAHFQELRNENLASFNQSAFAIEVGPEIEVENLLDQMLWGPQPKLKRGDIITVMRVDNAFFVQLICESISAGYPSMRVMSSVTRDAASIEPVRLGADGVEFHPGLPGGRAHVIVADGEIIAVADSQQEADAILAARSGGVANAP